MKFKKAFVEQDDLDTDVFSCSACGKEIDVCDGKDCEISKHSKNKYAFEDDGDIIFCNGSKHLCLDCFNKNLTCLYLT